MFELFTLYDDDERPKHFTTCHRKHCRSFNPVDEMIRAKKAKYNKDLLTDEEFIEVLRKEIAKDDLRTQTVAVKDKLRKILSNGKEKVSTELFQDFVKLVEILNVFDNRTEEDERFIKSCIEKYGDH